MLRPHRTILARRFALASAALFLPGFSASAETAERPEEPTVVLTDFTDVGETLFVAPASESDQRDAVEELNRALGPEVSNQEVPSGRWRVAPHLEMRATYDDNIFIQRENRVEDFILTIAPGITIGIWDSEYRHSDSFLDRQGPATPFEAGRGSYFVMDYTAILLGFARTDSQNAFDQDARIGARLRADKWTLGANLRYESKSETSTDIGARIRRKRASAEIEASYRISEKTSIDTSAYVRANDPEDYVKSVGWNVEGLASYELTPRVRIGVGGAVGGIAVDGGADEIYQRVLARAAYKIGEKINVEMRGGVEFRQSDGLVGDRVNPIFNIAATYEPSAGTRISVEAFRSVEASEFRPEESYDRMGITSSFQRAIRAGAHVHLDGGYQRSDYSGLAGEEDRQDSYYFVRPGVLWNVAEWANAALTYEFRSNDSNRESSSFDNNQIVFQVNLYY